jgi:hypothetical protein
LLFWVVCLVGRAGKPRIIRHFAQAAQDSAAAVLNFIKESEKAARRVKEVLTRAARAIIRLTDAKQLAWGLNVIMRRTGEAP